MRPRLRARGGLSATTGGAPPRRGSSTGSSWSTSTTSSTSGDAVAPRARGAAGAGAGAAAVGASFNRLDTLRGTRCSAGAGGLPTRRDDGCRSTAGCGCDPVGWGAGADPSPAPGAGAGAGSLAPLPAPLPSCCEAGSPAGGGGRVRRARGWGSPPCGVGDARGGDGERDGAPLRGGDGDGERRPASECTAGGALDGAFVLCGRGRRTGVNEAGSRRRGPVLTDDAARLASSAWPRCTWEVEAGCAGQSGNRRRTHLCREGRGRR